MLNVIAIKFDQRDVKQTTESNKQWSNPYVGYHSLEIITPTEKKQTPKKRCMYVLKNVMWEERVTISVGKNCTNEPGLCSSPYFRDLPCEGKEIIYSCRWIILL